MEIKRLKIPLLSACAALLFSSNNGHAQDSSFLGIWKLKEKQYVSGTVYVNAIPRLVTIIQMDNKFVFESKAEGLNGKDDVSYDTVNLDGSSRYSLTASKRRKEVRIENLREGSSFEKTSFFSLPDLPDKIDFTRKESWSLNVGKKDLTIIKEHVSTTDSIDKWKVQGEYEKTSLEEVALDKISGKGIQFQEGMSWEDVLKKAKTENKMIFVDCYATWCRPCKIMDVDVYPVDRVGELVNSKFISLKLQMDTAKGDNEFIKLLYPLAKQFTKEYNVFALPTFLFFSPDGKILHKNIGGMNVDEFLATVDEAIDPSRQLYTLLDRLHKGKIDYRELPELTIRVKELKERIPDSYIQSYFKGLNESKLLRKENIQFALDFIEAIRSADQLFKLSYKRAGDINKIMGRESAEHIVRFVITKEEITLQIDRAKERSKVPDWSRMKNAICKKYNCNYADVLLSLEQIGWYQQKKDWKNFTKSLVAYMDIEGFKKTDRWFSLDANAMQIVKYSKDKKQMASAVKWVDKAIKLMEKNENDKKFLPEVMDTRAALFYKMGNVKEAILTYEAIVMLNPNYNLTLKKLKAGEDPWEEIVINK